MEVIVAREVPDGDFLPLWLPVTLEINTQESQELFYIHTFVARLPFESIESRSQFNFLGELFQASMLEGLSLIVELAVSVCHFHEHILLGGLQAIKTFAHFFFAVFVQVPRPGLLSAVFELVGSGEDLIFAI